MLEQNKERRSYTLQYELHDNVCSKSGVSNVVSYTTNSIGEALANLGNDGSIKAEHIRDYGYLHDHGEELTHEEIESMSDEQVVRSFIDLDIGDICILVVM